MTDESSELIGNTDVLKRFVSAFNYRLITISIQPQQELAGATVPAGKRFSSQNRVRAFTLDHFFSSAVQIEIENAQMHGCAVYFMVNEGDGQPAVDALPGILNCGKRSNVRTLKSLFIDTDNADAHALLRKLKEISLLPHFIIETSPSRYHFYFLLHDEPAEGENIDQWIAVQKYLSSLVPGLDQTMLDINQVLRLPTFLNHKSDPPFHVSLFKESDRNKYTLSSVFHRLGCYTLVNYVNGATTGHYTPFEFPAGPVPPGNRRNTITRYIEHLIGNVLPINAKKEDYYVMVNGFIREYLKPEDQADFLPGGSRRANIEAYFEGQRNRRRELEHKKQNLQAIEAFEHVQAVESNTLPDDFYLTFPGDLGSLTREIHRLSPQLSLEVCFAGALCVSGAVKAEAFRFRGFWPLINGLVIAPTGAGKTTLKAIVKAYLQEAGLLGLYPQLIDFASTVQALHTALYSAGGVGTTLIDESGDYLSVITAHNAPGYVRALKKYYKESTTGPEQGNRLAPGQSLSFQVPPIDGGFLSLWMFIQPDKFSGSLSIEDMRDGFLPRFLVFKGKSSYSFGSTLQGEENSRRSFDVSLDMKVWLQAHAQLVPYMAEDQVVQAAAQARAQVLANTPRANAQVIALAQREAVYRHRSESRRMGPAVTVRASSEAHTAIGAYLAELQEKAVAIAQENDLDPQLDVYVRVEEMLGRLLCCAAGLLPGTHEAIVDLLTAEAMIRFHRFQLARFFGTELKEMTIDREVHALMEALHKAIKRNHGESVTTKQIRIEYRSTKRPSASRTQQLLKEAVDRGEVWAEKRKHCKSKDRDVLTYRPALSEEGPIQ